MLPLAAVLSHLWLSQLGVRGLHLQQAQYQLYVKSDTPAMTYLMIVDEYLLHIRHMYVFA